MSNSFSPSKRRLVIAAVLAGQSQSEAARTYGVSQGWVSRLMARYRDEGDAAFEPRSRAPRSNPGATAPETVELVLGLRKRLLDSGVSHLTEISPSGVSRLTYGRATPSPTVWAYQTSNVAPGVT